jgi:hypothetical protein
MTTMIDVHRSMFTDVQQQSEVDEHDPERQFGYPSTLSDESLLVQKAPPARGGSPAAIPHSVEQDGITIEKKMKKGVPNKDFEDLEETGKWGSVSRKEIICVTATLVILVVGVAVALFFLLDKKDPVASLAPPPAAVVPETVYFSSAQQYAALLGGIREHPTAIADTIMANFATDVNDLELTDNYTQAALWLTNDDPTTVKFESDLMPRFVLATTYYANGGTEWNETEKWMSAFDVCDWYGIRCNSAKEVIEVDLSKNGLSGSIHEAWALLPNCSSVILSENALDGPIPGAFGNMAKLTYLYLQDNQLTGTVPLSLKDAGLLGT